MFGVKTNLARVCACPRHRFEGGKPKLGDKLTCQVCGGRVNLTDAGYYIDGYTAAGVAPDDIWPGWNRGV